MKNQSSQLRLMIVISVSLLASIPLFGQSTVRVSNVYSSATNESTNRQPVEASYAVYQLNKNAGFVVAEWSEDGYLYWTNRWIACRPYGSSGHIAKMEVCVMRTKPVNDRGNASTNEVQQSIPPNTHSPSAQGVGGR